MSMNVFNIDSIYLYLFLSYALLLKTELLIPVFHKNLPCIDIQSLGFPSMFVIVPSPVLDLDTLHPFNGNKGPGGS